MSSSESRAVTIKTGVRLPAARRRRHTSKPSRCGISTSSTTASNSTCAEPLQRREPVVRGLDAVPLELERGFDGVAHVRIIVHDEHAPAPDIRRIHRQSLCAGDRQLAESFVRELEPGVDGLTLEREHREDALCIHQPLGTPFP